MNNIINTYLKVLKLTFKEYQSSNKDSNTIYFITDTQQIYIGNTLYLSAGDIITTQKIADGAVTTEKLANGSVTAEKLSNSLKTEIANMVINQLDSEIMAILGGDDNA